MFGDANDPLEQARKTSAAQANILLNQSISQCHKCPRLAFSVCRSGGCSDSGAAHAKLLVIGETMQEQSIGNVLFHAMDGSQGYDLLQRIWQELGVSSDQIFYINAVNCAGKQTPNPSEIKNCREHLDYCFRMLNPLAAILMGPMAMNAYWPDQSFHDVKGSILDLWGIPALVTYHPQHIYDFADLYGESGSQNLILELKNSLATCLQSIRSHPKAVSLFFEGGKKKDVCI